MTLPRLKNSYSSSLVSALAITVALFFLCLLPFGSALEVHHIFADIDHDGHEHSGYDLCQWVQAHGSGSVDFDHADIGVPIQVEQERSCTSEIVYSSVALTAQESRGPPLFL